MPNDNSAGRALMRASSWPSTLASSFDKPPPPYSLGHVGAVHPFAPMRSSQSLASGFLYVCLRPPQTASSSNAPPPCPRIEGGQFSSSHLRVSARKFSRSLMSNPIPLLRLQHQKARMGSGTKRLVRHARLVAHGLSVRRVRRI